MFRHFFKLGFIPTCYCMHVAIFVSHKFEVADWNGNRFRPNSKKSANINNDGASRPRAMNVIDGANFFFVDTIHCRSFNIFSDKFVIRQADMIGVIHLLSSLLGKRNICEWAFVPCVERQRVQYAQLLFGGTIDLAGGWKAEDHSDEN